ncbi:MAG: hypothetical protein PHC64_10020 [Candidatus Gastranaerophilales bacterium]|nr:hypothetical protein [Candidatus Gastranaerophilales bacterium]
MDNEYVKKLTSKNPNDFEFAASHIINNIDVKAFEALVEKGDFLFDFIKENVRKRLSNVITNYNYKNLLSFLKVYSYDYEDLIVSTLVKFADEDLTDKMLELLEKGINEEKAYAAKYFSKINDTLAIDLLRENSYSDFDSLAMNCAEALSAMKDEESYNLAIKKLQSEDEFEKLSAVRFLAAYKDKRAVKELFDVMKKSSMAENIASEISYIKGFLELIDTEFKNDTILAINYILNGLGEIISLSQVFDFRLFEVFEKLIGMQTNDSKIALLLLNAKLKFEQITENDEYIFDEDKETKNEIYEIKNLLLSLPEDFWYEQKKLFQNELDENSDFVFPALDLSEELDLTETFEKLKKLLDSSNQTIILKTVEVIKSIGKINEINKTDVLEKISDENIREIIIAL